MLGLSSLNTGTAAMGTVVSPGVREWGRDREWVLECTGFDCIVQV